MIDKISLIKKYFNEKASSWNDNNVVNINILNLLFDKGALIHNQSILDVGCGTGALFDYYLKNNAKSITGIDISDKMIDIAKAKYSNINLLCDDIISFNSRDKYDLIVIYNTLPHIMNLDLLFINLKRILNKNGKVIIAFGQSRDKTNLIHNTISCDISSELPEIDELCTFIDKYFTVIYSVSNEFIYEIICLNKK